VQDASILTLYNVILHFTLTCKVKKKRRSNLERQKIAELPVRQEPTYIFQPLSTAVVFKSWTVALPYLLICSYEVTADWLSGYEDLLWGFKKNMALHDLR
jgi:hypothetical protein